MKLFLKPNIFNLQFKYLFIFFTILSILNTSTSAQNTDVNFSVIGTKDPKILSLLVNGPQKKIFSDHEKQQIKNWINRIIVDSSESLIFFFENDHFHIRSQIFLLRILRRQLSEQAKKDISKTFHSIWVRLKTFEEQWLFLTEAIYYPCPTNFHDQLVKLAKAQSEPWMLRDLAIQILQEQSPSRILFLANNLNEESHPRVRASIVKLIENTKDIEIKNKIIEQAFADTWPVVRIQILESLSKGVEISALFEKGIEDRSNAVQKKAIGALVNLEDDSYWPQLRIKFENTKTDEEVLLSILHYIQYFQIEEALPILEKRCQRPFSDQSCSPLLFSEIQKVKDFLLRKGCMTQDPPNNSKKPSI